MAPPSIPYIVLNDGNIMPTLGYGFGTIHYVYNPDRSSIDEEVVVAGLMAIKSGFIHLDVAELWGNEKSVGEAIKRSGIPRERLFVTTKYASCKPYDMAKSLNQTLQRLGLDYVDQYLLHEPFFAKKSAEALQTAWAWMEWMLGTGRVRSIGVSNFLQKDLEVILQTARIYPAINQIEYHPYLQHGDLLQFQKSNGIAVSAYSTLTAVTKAAPGPVDDIYAALATKYNVTPGHIALRWVLDQGMVAITTSKQEDRLKQYMNINTFNLTQEEIEEIRVKGLEKGFRGSWTHKFAWNDFS